MLKRDDARSLLDRILKLGLFSEMSVSLWWRQSCHTRFANSQITTAGLTDDLHAFITVTKDRKSGSTSTTELTDEALAQAVRRAEEMAALSPENPEYVEPLGPQNYPSIPGHDPATAAARSAELLPAVRSSIQAVESKQLVAYGFYDLEAEALAIANKNGLFGYHQRTWADFSLTARTQDGTGSGWAESEAPAIARVDTPQVTAKALRGGIDSQKPRRLDPGKYTVILEPAALDEMLSFFTWNLGQRAADEGRSFMSKKGGGTLLGEKVFGENVSLRSDPADPRVPGWPWSDDLPAEKTTWVDKGVVKNLTMDRYWAKKTARRPVPYPGNMLMEGGTAKLEDLIASTDRGLLVTRFWYIRFLQPDTLQLTGLTRDGLFYIEKGKIQYPVMNFRFNQSVIDMLKQVGEMTAAVPVGRNVLPTILVRDFNMSSLSDAV